MLEPFAAAAGGIWHRGWESSEIKQIYFHFHGHHHHHQRRGGIQQRKRKTPRAAVLTLKPSEDLKEAHLLLPARVHPSATSSTSSGSLSCVWTPKAAKRQQPALSLSVRGGNLRAGLHEGVSRNLDRIFNHSNMNRK